MPALLWHKAAGSALERHDSRAFQALRVQIRLHAGLRDGRDRGRDYDRDRDRDGGRDRGRDRRERGGRLPERDEEPPIDPEKEAQLLAALEQDSSDEEARVI